MKRVVLLIISCLWLPAVAEDVPNLYQGVVPVDDRSNASRQQGISNALAQVLVKLTGDSRVLQREGVDTVLGRASDFIAAIGYKNLPPAGDSPDVRTGLQVNFSPQAIDRLIRRSQLTILPSNRPKMLLWIVRDDVQTGRQFVSSENALDDLPGFMEILDQRGMPWMLPQFDLQDQLALSVDDLWSLNAATIEEASRRYPADGWIALRYFTTSTGMVRGAWLYQVAGQRELNDVRAEDFEQFSALAGNQLSDHIARHFFYTPETDTSEIAIQIDGVNNYRSYRIILEQLKKLELVHQLQVRRVDGNSLTLAVEVEGDIALLQSALIRSGGLISKGREAFGVVSEAVVPGTTPGYQLIFDWIGE